MGEHKPPTTLEMSNSNPSSYAAPPTVWKDLPRRFLTVGIGVPGIALQMRYYFTSWLFFQVSHLICLLEWKNLIPPTGVEDCKKNDDVAGTSRAAAANGSNANGTQQKVYAILFDDKWNSLSDLERCEFYVFSFCSLTMTMIPTPLLPLAVMFAGISLRMIQYIPKFQSSTLQSIHTIQHYQFGLVYISTGFHYLLQIRRDGGARHIGCLLFIVWMSDTGALILGRLMNKYNNKNSNGKDGKRGVFLSFLKAISPGKTIPGLIGGVVTGPISSLLYPIEVPSSASLSNISFLHINNHILQKLILGLILSAVGIIGDLAESSVKRMSGKKDSGGLLPGHGGVVDRFDSLFTAGIVYFYLILA